MHKALRIAASGAVIAALLSTAACTSPADPDGEGSESKGAVAMSFPGGDIPLWIDTLEYMKPIVEAAGYEFLADDAQWNVNTQVSNWQGWIQRGDVKAIMGYAAQSGGLVAVTEQAKDAGIPVVGYAGAWDGVDYAMVIDGYQEGYNLGTTTGKWIVENYGSEAIDVGFFQDRSGDLGKIRSEGVDAGLADTAPNAVVHALPATTREDGYTVTQSQLVATPDMKVWIGHGDDPMLGAYQALMDSGVAPDDPSYLLASLDALNETLKIIQLPGSIWRYSFTLPAKFLAESNAKVLLGAAEGTLTENLVIESIPVDASNAADYIVE